MREIPAKPLLFTLTSLPGFGFLALDSMISLILSMNKAVQVPYVPSTEMASKFK